VRSRVLIVKAINYVFEDNLWATNQQVSLINRHLLSRMYIDARINADILFDPRSPSAREISQRDTLPAFRSSRKRWVRRNRASAMDKISSNLIYYNNYVNSTRVIDRRMHTSAL